MNLRFAQRFALVAVTLAALAFAAPSALAHAHLGSASPAANAVVASPQSITLTFTEPLEPRFSGFEILDAGGRRVDAPSRVDPQNHAVLVATPADPLTPGVYRVTWHIVAHDGHRMRGEYRFTVH
jgi:copper resistance protein C